MKRGLLLIAHNTINHDYYRMATIVAERAERYLKLPTTVITDNETLETTGASPYSFHNTITVQPDKSNFIRKSMWINKGRYRVFEYSPYDETLVLDTDYQINSTRLLDTFNNPSDFVCPRTAKYIFDFYGKNEPLSYLGLGTYWATIMRFNKTQRVEDLFTMMGKIQENYEYYSEIHRFMPYSYRNDYALTLALRAVNGHIERPEDFIQGSLYHVDKKSTVKRVIEEGDSAYTISKEMMVNNRPKRLFIKVRDFDFHMLDKHNFLEINI